MNVYVRAGGDPESRSPSMRLEEEIDVVNSLKDKG
jgi:hypothetical protein